MTFLCAALAPTSASASPDAQSRPAFWVVRDADTTIYLFGTFHTLSPDRDWLTPQVDHALSSAAELVLETVVPKSPAERGASVGKLGGSDYLRSTSKVIADGRARGMSTEFGADQVLRTLAEDSGKPVSGLEDFGAQLRTLSTIGSRPVPASAVAAPAPAQTVTLDQLFKAWKAGDCGAFATMLAGFKSRSPAAYEALIAGRNKAWAAWIQARLDTPGTVFVAVGSGHLTGADSVQEKLASNGIHAMRIG